MIIKITPVPKPRMTQRDRWAKRPAVVRYHEFCDALRTLWGHTGEGDVPESLSLTFFMPMPKSWSDKKKANMLNKPHQQRPDIDNLAKAFLDALCEDDSYVYHLEATKVWSGEGAIQVEPAHKVVVY